MNRAIPRTSTHSFHVHPAVWSLVALGLCAGLLAAIAAGTFSVKQVVVQGKGVPQALVVQDSGLMGQNIFTVQSDEVVARLATVRQIAVQRVATTFPDQVTIYAKVRVPIAAWRRANALYLLDSDGHIINQVKATTLPTITSTGGGSLDPATVEAVRESVKMLPAVPNGGIASFQYDGRTGLTIQGKMGWRALVGRGSAQTLANRVATLAAFFRATRDRGVVPKIVDLRYRTPYAHY
jgi:cell division septal protein FtsQ